MAKFITGYPHFFTVTNLQWNNLLQIDKYKDVIIASMKHLVKERRVIIYGLVIMSNHLHIIWQLQTGQKRENVQRDFLKHTAQAIKEDMLLNKPVELKAYLVNARDRKHQFWERNALSVELWSEKVFMQKLKYIHENPVRAGICKS